MTTESKQREEIALIGQSLFDRGLTMGSSGNISVRTSDGGWLMTPTNACLGRLDPDRISRLDEQGQWCNGDKPTKESFLHMTMYQENRNSSAVVHLHSTHSVAVSCLPEIDHSDCIPPITAYYVMRVGRLPLVPYHIPGDPELADAVRGLAGKHSSILLANHGPIVAGKSLEAATYAIEELEETAKLFLLLRGHNPRVLTEQEVEELSRKFG
ncbi:3-oxo-tetronate 4-phosphate decarboxylase [Saccharospirillum alexandrii]|uniref:3-oxo-tetronate 4-phosphate decarboxylase n=1 Tax=Saccharospirillum alexandrii TaxID=2448477 RepID=UPI000FDBB919|nr:3-oxo-tetronate 4-phosphate decarboxylase [Saccharospirillum alexandrii]